MRSKRLEHILVNIPLKTRLKVCNEMALIDMLTELGFRENKMWTDDENELLEKLMAFAFDMTRSQLKEIKQWELDGKP